MPKFLSKQQVEQYHEQGFLAPRSSISWPEISG